VKIVSSRAKTGFNNVSWITTALGQVMMTVDLAQPQKYLLDLEWIQAISVRAVVEGDWLELAHKLPPGRQIQRDQSSRLQPENRRLLRLRHSRTEHCSHSPI
jgi:hypothetical protein